MNKDNAMPVSMSIDWFPNLTFIVESYMDVLRYEMGASGATETLEALLHGEIVKILNRDFDARHIISEFPIRSFFAKKDREDTVVGGIRCDILLTKPWRNRWIRHSPWPQHERLALAAIEIKRSGAKTGIADDIYRLAVLSKKLHCISYFVIAAPTRLLVDHARKVEALLPRCSVTDTRVTTLSCDELKSAKLYDSRDDVGAFYVSTQFINESFAEIYALRNDELEFENKLRDEEDRYHVIILGVSTNRERLSRREHQTFSLAVSLAEAPQQPLGPDLSSIKI